MTLSNHDIVVRWLDARDHTNLLDLLRCCYRLETWSTPDLMKFLHSSQRRNNIKVAADDDGTIYGTLFYSLGTGTCTIRRLAVWPDYRRRGLGQFLLGSLLKAGSPLPPKVLAFVPPANVIAQAFFSRLGFQTLDEADEHGRSIFEFQKTELRSPVEG